MKKNFKELATIAVAVLFCANVVSAQMYHGRYFPPTGSNFLSLVNTTNPISYESWYIFTDDANRVIINKMDYNMFCPDVDNTKTYNLPISGTPPLGKIYFKDCFFVPDGSAIFCYGWEDSQMRGVMLRININAAGVVTGINFSNLNQANSPITSACWANNTGNTALYGNYCFGIIAGNKAARVFVTNAGAFTINGNGNGNNKAQEIRENNPLYSICYDPVQNYFLASGTYGERYVIFTKIDNAYNTVIPNNGFNELSSNLFDFNVAPNSFRYNFQENEDRNYRNVITVTDSGKLFLAQSIYTFNGYYLIWLINYDYYNDTMLSSTLYSHASKNNYLSNIAVDYYNNNLYLLGHHHSDRKFLLQIDMQNPASMGSYRMQHMTDAFVGSYGFYPIELEYLSSMSFSELFLSMAVSGAVDGEAFIVLAYDLNSNTCDDDVNVYTFPHSYNEYNFNTLQIATLSATLPRPTTEVNEYAMPQCTEGCQSMSPRQLQELQSQIEERLQERNKAMQKPQPQIKVMEKQFVISNFEGNCKFKIIDMLGRTMQQGSTQNGVINNINVSTSGIYIISVADEKNNVQNSKAVISQ